MRWADERLSVLVSSIEAASTFEGFPSVPLPLLLLLPAATAPPPRQLSQTSPILLGPASHYQSLVRRNRRTIAEKSSQTAQGRPENRPVAAGLGALIGPDSASICSVSESYLDTWSRMSRGVALGWYDSSRWGWEVSFWQRPRSAEFSSHPQTGKAGRAEGSGLKDRLPLRQGSPCGEPGSAGIWHPRPRLPFGAGEMRHQDHGRGRLATRDTTRPCSPPRALPLDSRDSTRPPDSAKETVRRPWSHTCGCSILHLPPALGADARTTPSPTCPCEASSRENSVDRRLFRISAFEWHPSQRLTTPPHAGIASGTRRGLDNHPFPRRHARCCLDNTCVLGRHQWHLLIIDVPSGVGEFRHRRPSPPVVPVIDLPALDQTSRRGRVATLP